MHAPAFLTSGLLSSQSAASPQNRWSVTAGPQKAATCPNRVHVAVEYTLGPQSSYVETALGPKQVLKAYMSPFEFFNPIMPQKFGWSRRIWNVSGFRVLG